MIEKLPYVPPGMYTEKQLEKILGDMYAKIDELVEAYNEHYHTVPEGLATTDMGFQVEKTRRTGEPERDTPPAHV